MDSGPLSSRRRRLGRGLELVGGAGLLALHGAALRLGVRSRIDGWRRSAGLVLRGPRSSFILSAFGLRVPSAPGDSSASRDRITARLAEFLQSRRECHVRVRVGIAEDRAEAASAPCYTLAFEPWAEGAARFKPPFTWSPAGDAAGDRDDRSAVLLSLVCRAHPSGQIADLWARVNHVGADGVPVQELLSALENAWGVDGNVVYPTPEDFAPHRIPCDGDSIVTMQSFVDFAPLLEWRKRQNATLAEPMTLSAAIIWCLGQRNAFSGRHIGTTVEVEATDGLARGVGVVVVRPADYVERGGGLAEYVRDFNRQLALTRRRASPGCKTLDAAAFVPPNLSRTLLRHALENNPRAFGTMALTMLKDAKVFGAPLAEAGHRDGFIAIGSVALPTRDGRRVGCVTVKGAPGVVAGYPALLQEAVRACGRA